jgi:DNA-binding transcriptional MerR regulator
VLKEKEIKVVKNIKVNNPLKDIDNYNNLFTISKVVVFFERQQISFTKTMIQNYVKIELLPPPKDKRYYTRQHLMLLVIIDLLKNVYSLDEIKEILKPFIKHFESNLIHELYYEFMNIYEEEVRVLGENIVSIVKKSQSVVDNYEVDELDKEQLSNNLSIVNIMIQSVVSKQISNIIITKNEQGD